MSTSFPLPTAGFAHPKRNVEALGIKPGMTVVDFGSGSGIYVLHIAEELDHKGHVYAVDIQRDLLRRVKNEAQRRGFKNVDVIWTDLEHSGSSKLADESVDLVLISNLLFQLHNKDAVFKEASRILRPTGQLVIIDWQESFGGMGPQESDVVPKEKAVQYAFASRFEFQREFPAGAHHYGIVFGKSVRT